MIAQRAAHRVSCLSDRASRRGDGRRDDHKYTQRDLRATFATHLVSAGRPIAEVGDLLGHADAGITAANHYARYRRGAVALHLRPSELVVNLIELITAASESREARAEARVEDSPAECTDRAESIS